MTEQLYIEGLLQAYEDEITGEAYFRALAGVFPEPPGPEKLNLLADVENRTEIALRPLIKRHGLKSCDKEDLKAQGKIWASERAFQSWGHLIENMATQYPGYIEKFKELKAMCPTEDRSAIETLVQHEEALLAFAERERAGYTDTLASVRVFMVKYR